MRFQVPQFIEVEDKVFGPLTFKQFIYLLGGGAISFLLYLLLPLWIAVPLIVVVVGFSLSLAFYKVNNRPFIDIVEAWLKYYIGSKLYVWKKREKKIEKKKEEKQVEEPLYVPKVSDSKLRDLAWSLDIKNPEVVNDERNRQQNR